MSTRVTALIETKQAVNDHEFFVSQDIAQKSMRRDSDRNYPTYPLE